MSSSRLRANHGQSSSHPRPLRLSKFSFSLPPYFLFCRAQQTYTTRHEDSDCHCFSLSCLWLEIRLAVVFKNKRLYANFLLSPRSTFVYSPCIAMHFLMVMQVLNWETMLLVHDFRNITDWTKIVLHRLCTSSVQTSMNNEQVPSPYVLEFGRWGPGSGGWSRES